MPSYAVDANGAALNPSFSYQDTTRDEDCVPLQAADGTTRCLPQTTADHYADSGCTAPLVSNACNGRG